MTLLDSSLVLFPRCDHLFMNEEPTWPQIALNSYRFKYNRKTGRCAVTTANTIATSLNPLRHTKQLTAVFPKLQQPWNRRKPEVSHDSGRRRRRPYRSSTGLTVTQWNPMSYRRLTDNGNHSIWCCRCKACRIIDMQRINAIWYTWRDTVIDVNHRVIHSFIKFTSKTIFMYTDKLCVKQTALTE